MTASLGYTTAERFRSPSVKSTPSSTVPDDDDVPISKPLEASAPPEAQPANGNKTSATDDEHANGNDNSTSSAAEENHTEEEVTIITVVTRGTSPTPPPALTAYSRTKRLEPAPKPVQKEVKRSEARKIERQDREQQVDRSSVEDTSPSRYTSRYSGGTSSRVSATPWVSSYLDKYTPRYTASSSSQNRVSSSYGYNSRSRNDDSSSAYASKDSSTRSTASSSLSDAQSRQNSSSRASDRSSPKIGDTSQKKSAAQRNGSEDRSRSEASRETSPRIVEGQDQGQASRRESLSRSSDVNSSGQSRAGSVSRSGSIKSRHQHLTSPGTAADSAAVSSSSAVSLPTGCSAGRSSGKAAASSTSSAGAAASPTKIKSAAATSTASALLSSSSSSNNSSSKCASAAGSAAASSTRQAMSPDARDRKPPVPKSEMVGKSSTGGPGPLKYVNKDFRKSALNMENGDPSRSQICERKLQKNKCQRSVSVSSQDSQSEANSESAAGTQQVASSGSSGSLRSNKSKTPISKSASLRKLELRKSNSKSPCNNGRVSRTMSVSTSECTSTENSSSESSEESEEDEQPESKQETRRRRAPDSPFADGKGKMSAGSSRTSVLASSADELSVNTDKPPRPPSSPRSRSDRSGKTEEAKSFLMRALAPVTNLFKSSGKQENGVDIRNGGWVEACSEENSDNKRNSIAASQNLSKSLSFTNSSEKNAGEQDRTRTRLRSSGEKPWWLDPNSDNVPDGVERNPSRNDDVSQDTTISTVLPDDGKRGFFLTLCETVWWVFECQLCATWYRIAVSNKRTSKKCFL